MIEFLEDLAALPTDRYEAAEWQADDLEQLIARDWSANFSEMGCYKTTTGLWLAMNKTMDLENPRVLIVTTKGGKGTYFDAVPKSLDPNTNLFNIHATNFSERIFGTEFKLTPLTFVTKFNSEGGIVLAHYHCFANRSKVLPILMDIEWDFVLVDEAHRMKDRKTQWTRNLKKLGVRRNEEVEEGGEFKHVMTGTGFINNPAELWSLLHFLDRRVFPSYHSFRQYYCDEIIVGGFPKILGVKPDKVEEFRELRKSVGVRREMAEVHSHIEKPIFTSRIVDLNPTQRKMYDEIKAFLYTLDKQGEPINSPNVLSQLNRLRQICVATPEVVGEYYDKKQERRVLKIKLTEPSSKLDEVMEILEELPWDLDSKAQVVVFSNFKDPLELLKVRLDKQGISYMHMEAKHNDKERYRMWHDEFPKKEHRVFMSTLQLGGESINLTPATYCIFLDRSWSPKDNMQGVGRVYRPGQDHGVEVIHINAIRTTDQRIEHVTNEKVGWFNEIFGADMI